MKKRVLAVCVVVAMLLSLAACQTTNPPATSGSASVAPSAAATATKVNLGVSEIKIGFVGPITGPYAGLGYSIDKVAKMVVDDLNKAGGIMGVPVKYISRDDTGDPVKSATYVKELVEKEGVKLMIGPSNSTAVSASLQEFTDNKVIVMLPSASAATLIDPVKYPYMFRNQVNNDLMAENLIQTAKAGGYKSIVLIGDNSALGTDGIAATKKYATQYGVTLAATVSYAPGTADMTPVAQQIAAAKPDAVIAFATGKDAATIVGALDRVGQTGKYIWLGYMGCALVNFAEIAGAEPTKYVTYQGLKAASVVDGDPNPNLGFAQPFYDKVQTYGKYALDGTGRDWDMIGAYRATDCINLFKFAVEKAQSLDGDKLKAALETVTPENFKAAIFESGYRFTATNHEGFNAKELASVYMGRTVVNTGKIQTEPEAVRIK